MFLRLKCLIFLYIFIIYIIFLLFMFYFPTILQNHFTKSAFSIHDAHKYLNSFGVGQQVVKKRQKYLEMTQKLGYWGLYELKPKDVEHFDRRHTPWRTTTSNVMKEIKIGSIRGPDDQFFKLGILLLPERREKVIAN